MNAIVKKIEISDEKRMIVISDIHGNLDLLKKLLSKVSYSEHDILILLGDLIEKGNKNLETLRYLIKLSQEQEVYIVKGNCDIRWKGIEDGNVDEHVLKHSLFRKNSILREMCQELQIDIDKTFDIHYIKKELRKNFSLELNWLEDLPHIIETEKFIFVHAGITSENLADQQAKDVLKRDAFMAEGTSFSKYVIVGHWPTANYGKERGCCNPIIDKERKIISIDGGNGVKSEGQLNAFIIEGEIFSFDAVDDFPRAKVIKDQKANTSTIQITWIDNAITVLEESEEFSYCRHLSSNHELWIKNDKLFKAHDCMRCYDSTDYFIEAQKGDVVSILEKAKERTLVKKEGLIGWIENAHLKAALFE